jgi:hypothetical protein
MQLLSKALKREVVVVEPQIATRNLPGSCAPPFLVWVHRLESIQGFI